MDAAETIVELLKAIAHPVRLRLAVALAGQEEHVGGLAERIGSSQAVVSQQLRILRMSGVVDSARGNGRVVYRLARPELRNLLACLERCCAEHGRLHGAEAGTGGGATS